MQFIHKSFILKFCDVFCNNCNSLSCGFFLKISAISNGNVQDTLTNSIQRHTHISTSCFSHARGLWEKHEINGARPASVQCFRWPHVFQALDSDRCEDTEHISRVLASCQGVLVARCLNMIWGIIHVIHAGINTCNSFTVEHILLRYCENTTESPSCREDALMRKAAGKVRERENLYYTLASWPWKPLSNARLCRFLHVSFWRMKTSKRRQLEKCIIALHSTATSFRLTRTTNSCVSVTMPFTRWASERNK